MSIFQMIEINSTFYQPPRLETAERWRQTAPPNFEFTLKAWQLITHPPTSPTYRKLSEPIPERCRNRYGSFLPTPEVQQAWRRTLAVAQALKATIILLQSPATFVPTPDNIAHLRRFLRWAPRGSAHLAWEPRGEWPASVLVPLCREHHLTLAGDPFKSKHASFGIRYFRLHGSYAAGRIQASHRYTDAELEKLRTACDQPVNYVFFNNVDMFKDAQRFLKLVSPIKEPVLVP